MEKSKRGLSTVVASIIMIGLVMASGIIVWSLVHNTLKDSLDEASSCSGIFDKVKIDGKYTCYNVTSKELKFFIDVDDVELDSLIIAISDSSTKKSVTLKDVETSYLYLRKANGNYNEPIKVPGKNSGISYVANLEILDLSAPQKTEDSFETMKIEISPNIGGNQCQISDSISDIFDCRVLA